MKRVAIIPARGGSTRIPRKNIKVFCGKPMIAWSIIVAQVSGCFDRIIVSTEDEEIACVAQQWGAEVPFTRPKELSDQYTVTRPVINHAINWLRDGYFEPDFVCCIYATAPFVQPEDLRVAFKMLHASERHFAFPVTTYAYPIQRALRRLPEGGVEMFNPENVKTRSQDLEEAYHDAGQFYWGRTEAFLSDSPTFSEQSIAIVIPRHRVQDIDTHEDWSRAERLFKMIESGIADGNS